MKFKLFFILCNFIKYINHLKTLYIYKAKLKSEPGAERYIEPAERYIEPAERYIESAECYIEQAER